MFDQTKIKEVLLQRENWVQKYKIQRETLLQLEGKTPNPNTNQQRITL